MTQHNSNLSLNQQGKDVALLQSRLITIGYTVVPSEIHNELFGENTQQAVLHFQRAEGMLATGRIDALMAQVRLTFSTAGCRPGLARLGANPWGHRRLGWCLQVPDRQPGEFRSRDGAVRALSHTHQPGRERRCVRLSADQMPSARLSVHPDRSGIHPTAPAERGLGLSGHPLRRGSVRWFYGGIGAEEDVTSPRDTGCEGVCFDDGVLFEANRKMKENK